MKKFGFGRRLLAMLLVLGMVLGYIPAMTARAVTVGTIVDDASTGLDGEIDTTQTISWPIKIYDYLNDGMLFEYSSAQDTSITEATGGAYGGGQPMPTIWGDDNIVNDYTTVNGYYKFNGYTTFTAKNAFTKWGNKSSYAVSYDTSAEGATEVERQIIQPVKGVSPMYMRWNYVGTRGSKAYSWISNFAQDDGVYYAKEDVRYMVIVYKTNEAYGTASGDYLGNGHTLRPFWSVTDTAYSDGDTVTGVDISDVSTDHGWKSGSNPTGTLVAAEVRIKPSTDKWAYQIIDMKTDGPMASGQSGYGIKENWDTEVLSGKKIAGIGISIPLSASGETMDVSHIGYFPSEKFARYFGERAVAFDNDPGEYMGSTITMTHTADGGTASSSYTAPTVSTGLDLTKTTANGGSWSDSAVTDWWNGQGLDVDDAKFGTSGGYYYARISEPNSGLDTAYVKKGSTNYYVSNYRYITLVYRTNISSPKVGFWIERDGYPAGKGFNGTSYTDKRVSITQSTSEWKSLVYDVAQINNWDTDYNSLFNGSTLDQIAIMFPGFNSSSEYMDIAYVNFASSSSDANTFATNAKNYLNNFTVSGADSVTTTLTKTTNPNGRELWNMGSNQAFTMLYSCVGGGWAEDGNSGGENLNSNGYYSYQIGKSYMLGTNTSTANNDRTAALTQAGKNYNVSDSIFLLNTYTNNPNNLYGVTYTLNSSGNAIDSTKRFDMSQLPLGYKLYNTMKEGGVMTAGLLQSGIATYTGTDGVEHRVMNYKSDTVHYIATLLRDSLTVPVRDYWGYNYNYVMGTASPMYSEDVDGDGKLDLYNEDLDNDGHLDDRNEDTNGDGILDLSEDIDRDGHLDVYEDLDGDGEIDLAEDLDGDGFLDYWEDMDYDGMIDPGEDRDGDGKLDVGEDLDYDGHLDVDEDLNHNGLLDDGEDVDGDGKLDVDEDVNGNGKLDVWNEDVNHNGVLDEGEDVNGNGKLDRGEDRNCNGKLDAGEDVDGDGRLDMGEDLNHNGILDPGEDTNGNGKLDVGEDVNYNGILDEGEDLNGNGILDLEDRNGNGILDLGEDLDGDFHLDNGEDKNNNGVLDEGEDINGNGKLDLHEDLDNDGHLDVAEDLNGNGKLDSCDLATALRQCLKITFPDNIEERPGGHWTTGGSYTSTYNAANDPMGTMGADLGSYADTMARINARIAQDGVNPLIGPFLKCRDNIKTAFDASYYLLHNLFVANSYNSAESDYKYLVMSKATVSGENKEAFVFDAGFSAADKSNATVYDLEQETIYQTTAAKKHEIYYTSAYKTTLNPFLPVNDDGEGPESAFRYNGTPYLREDGATDISQYGDSYALRNYNYVMAANGEFVYHHGEDLFFDFEGDDDVYMFVNGELVLDIGAAHSITKVGFQMNDYVDAARAILGTLTSKGYAPGMDDAMFAQLLADLGITETNKHTISSGTYAGSYTASDLMRWHKLNLVDGQDYPIDFYYMERHGWGANMRIATNIVMTDPTLTPGKGAEQGTDIYGDPIKIESGDLIDDSKPINYNFSITNEGNTKLYRLAFEDQNIGVSLTPTGGLQVYGQPTKTQFNLTSETTLTVSGIDGVMNLDGGIYWLSADGTITTPSGSHVTSITIPYTAYDADLDDADVNKHTMTIYQYGGNTLMEDKTATVVLGTSGGTSTPSPDSTGMITLQDDRTYLLEIDGIRVTDSNGKKLDPADLVFTVTGYASEEDYAAGKEIDPITVRVADNIQLKAFLTTLQDPKGQTGEGEGVPEGKSALFYGAGLWRHGTVKVSGIYYTLSEEEQEAMVFNNTVYTTAYKSLTSTVPIKNNASHTVYCPGDPMYYQWAGHTINLPLTDFWADVVASSQIEDTVLGEKKSTVADINSAGIENFNVEIVDKNGNKVSVSDNYYNNGSWYTFPGSTLTAEAGKRTIYYKHYYDWSAAETDTVYVYYWSDTNNNMVSWPGVEMSVARVDGDKKTVYKYDIPANAEYVIFNNGDVNNMTQTADITVPLVDYDKVQWNETDKVLKVFYDNPGKHMFYVKLTNKTDSTLTVTVPVTFYVTKTEDKTYVLDYGLSTEELNSGGLLFKNDEFLATELLGNKTFTETKLMGISTTEPTYLGTYSADADKLGNINRINFTSTAATKVEEGTDFYYDLGDGRYYMNTTVAQAGNEIVYMYGNYSMSTQLWFTPEEFMDEPYELWLAISVHEKDAVGPGETGDKVYHAPTGVSTTEDTTGTSNVDIKTEVQMYKKITVLPATVVYYEDDFMDITYNNTAEGKFVHHGDGSGTLTQGVEQDVPYGQDATYQHGSNVEMSGESLTQLEITDPNEQASFTFTGTGFEIISRTNATDAASFVVEVFKQTAAGEELVKRLPVITEFTSSASACTHTHHDSTGHCSSCNMDVGHTFNNGVCTVCNVAQPTYYLMGNINGSDYSENGFVFEDGELTVTFEKDSYVVVRDDGGNEYWTNGYYANASSLVLYNTKTYGDKISANKMHVPAGVELTFHLIDNGNGAMTLSYSTEVQRYGPRTVYFDNSNYGWENVYIYHWAAGFTGPNPWPGVPMTKVEGSDTLYTFVVPSDANMVIFNNGISQGSGAYQTGDMVVPGDGYVFKNGTWSVYGEGSGEVDPGLPTTKTVYFRDTAGWGTAYIHYWNTGSDTSWPGLQMSLVEGETDLYCIEVPMATSNLLFHNNAGTQTSDLTIPAEVDPPLYNYANGWFSYGDDESGSAGDEDTITLYFNNTGNWGTPYAHYWGGTGGTEWPGNAMTHVDGDVYSITLNADNKNIIFNNNDGTQTGDLTILGDGYRYRLNGGTDGEGKLTGNWIYPSGGTTKVVYLKNTYGWKDFYAWAWGEVNGTTVNCFDQWPGTPMTVVGETAYYAVTVPVEAQYIIFSDGDSNETGTLTLDDSKPTYENGQWTATDPNRVVPREIFFENEEDWTNVYVYPWAESQGDLVAWPGVKMEVSSDDFWSAEIPGNSKYVIFHDGKASNPNGLTPVNVHETNNAYSSSGWGTYVDVDTDEIYQVPVIKVDLSEEYGYGTYRVSICGMTQYDDSIDWSYAGSLMSEAEAAEDAKNELAQIEADYGSLEARVEALKAQGEDKEADRVANLPNVIARGPVADSELTAYLADHVMPVILYIDGVRVYQPIASNGVNGTHDLYAVNENSAAFKELRDLILDGQAAVAVYNEDSTTTYSGNYSWSENRNGVLYDWDTEDKSATTTKYTGNQLDGIDDYLLVGPNNECYVNGNMRDEAVVFYVTEDTTVKDHTLQIGVHGLDQGLFLYGQSSGVSAALYQGVMISYPDGTSAQGWSPVAAISSSTEQYYEIDYKSCPSFLKEIDGEEVRVYQVALYVRSGMVSFTNVKYKSLSIVDLGASKTSYQYNDQGYIVEVKNGTAEGSGEVSGENKSVALDFASVSAQMRSDIYTGEIVELPEAPEAPETPDVPETPEVDTVVKPTLDPKHASLSFEDEILYNIYYAASDLDDVVEMGLVTFGSQLTNGTIADAADVIPGYITDGEMYMVSTNGIAAKNMGDEVYFKVYAKLSDGSYVYSGMNSYSAVKYANTILGRTSSSADMKALVVAMLNYGAEAQQFFGYRTDSLMNASLTAQQQALNAAYDESMVADLVSVDQSKAVNFVYTASAFTDRYPSVSFDGAFSINFYFTAANAPDDGMTFYYWDLETYDSVDELTADNATGTMEMILAGTNKYYGVVDGIAAKEMDETVFVAGVYEIDGVEYTTGIIAYSLGQYCQTIAAKDSSDQQSFAQATAVYGYYAKTYFEGL